MEVVYGFSTWKGRNVTDVVADNLTSFDMMSEVGLSTTWDAVLSEEEQESASHRKVLTGKYSGVETPFDCIERSTSTGLITGMHSGALLYDLRHRYLQNSPVPQCRRCNEPIEASEDVQPKGSDEHVAIAVGSAEARWATDPELSKTELTQGAIAIKEETQVVDLDMDSLIICASLLGTRDLANMALSCRRLRDAAYSDTVWELQCGKRWPAKQLRQGKFVYSGGRQAYVARHTATHQLRFMDPVDWQFQISPSPVSHLSLEEDIVTVAQGPNISVWKLGSAENPPTMIHNLRDHNARITCMRRFPTSSLGTLRNCLRGEESLLVSSSCDHTIRLWGKGRNLRTFRGHTGPVSILADHLLGDNTVLASGGLDGTVRLWALPSASHRGRSPLLATLYSHENAVRELAVAGHNTSLLVSAGKDCKVRVWDATAASVLGTGSCVGSTRSPGLPAALKCDGALCYVVGGSAAVVIDLRIMRTVATVATHDSGILSFAIGPCKSAICTGGIDGTAKLWDVRKSETVPEPRAVLGNHVGPVACVHLDAYKVVTGGPDDSDVYVWDARAGCMLNTLDVVDDQDPYNRVGLSAFAIQGTRMVTGTCAGVPGAVRIRDFSNCTAIRIGDTEAAEEVMQTSRFWDK